MANLRTFENQLKNYLLRKIKNGSDYQLLMRKYGSIKFSMDHQKYDRPHFIIRIGISEAVFDINTGFMISGGLGNESNDIKTWTVSYLKRAEIKSIWQIDNKSYHIQKEYEEKNTSNTKRDKNT